MFTASTKIGNTLVEIKQRSFHNKYSILEVNEIIGSCFILERKKFCHVTFEHYGIGSAGQRR